MLSPYPNVRPERDRDHDLVAILPDFVWDSFWQEEEGISYLCVPSAKARNQ
jgi:hypothetical protein